MPVNYPVEKIIDEEGNVLALVDVRARALLGDDILTTNAQTCTGAINELKGTLDESVTLTLNTPTGKIDSIGGRADRLGKFVTVSIDLTMNNSEYSNWIDIGSITPPPKKIITQLVLSNTTFTNAKQLRFYINTDGTIRVFYGGSAEFNINVTFTV